MELIGLLIVDGILVVGIPFAFSGLVWWVCRLWKRPLRWWGSILVFIPGALTACVWYGHRGPVWLLQLVWSNVDGHSLSAGLWMLGSGLFMVWLFALLSFRLSRRPPED